MRRVPDEERRELWPERKVRDVGGRRSLLELVRSRLVEAQTRVVQHGIREGAAIVIRVNVVVRSRRRRLFAVAAKADAEARRRRAWEQEVAPRRERRRNDAATERRSGAGLRSQVVRVSRVLGATNDCIVRSALGAAQLLVLAVRPPRCRREDHQADGDECAARK
jgi:hypothetical protein